jgi:hypothetical protein
MKFFTSVSNQITQNIQLTQYHDLIFFVNKVRITTEKFTYITTR